MIGYCTDSESRGDGSATSACQAEVDRELTKEHDDDEADDTTRTSLQRRDGADKGGTGDGADGQEQGSRHKGEESGTNESTDSKGDQTVREQLRSLRVGVTTVLVGVVDEEGSDGDLSSDVAELGGETEQDSEVGLLLGLLGSVHVGDDLVLLGHRVAHVGLGKLGEQVRSGYGDPSDSDSQVDVLNVLVRVLVLIAEKVLGSDERTTSEEAVSILMAKSLPIWPRETHPVKEATPLKD